MLIPKFHKYYWLGLISTVPTWPAFTTIDRTIPDPVATLASRWGQSTVLSCAALLLLVRGAHPHGLCQAVPFMTPTLHLLLQVQALGACGATERHLRARQLPIP